MEERNSININASNGTFCAPTLSFIDKDNQELSFAKVAKLEHSFLLDLTTNKETIEEDFSTLDVDRFYIRIRETENIGTIKVTLESYDEAGAIIDEIKDLELTYNTTSLEYNDSHPIILVTDNDTSDDDFQDSDFTTNIDESTYGGVDDEESDLTIFADIQGKIRAKLVNDVGVNMNYCGTDDANVIKKVKLNLIQMVKPDGTFYFEKEEILNEVKSIKRAWQQSCITFVDMEGGEIDMMDIIPMADPENVELDDGLDELTPILGVFGQLIGVEESVEMVNLQNHIKNIYPAMDKIDVIFIDNFVMNEIPQVNARGIGLYDDIMGPPYSDPTHARSVFITTNKTIFTTPHEIGHIITNLGHYGINYELDATNGQQRRNLMRDGTSAMDGVDESKRIIQVQMGFARDRTNLPQE